MQIPQIYINLDYFYQLGAQPMPLLLWQLFRDGGWILVVWVLLMAGSQMFLQWRQGIYLAGMSYSVLAINVPRMNEQTPKAVENIFTAIAGTYIPPDFLQKWWDGMVQLTFSFEIVSIDGYVQYLVRCPSRYRDLIEAAIYAQYPEADIVEVADYAERVPMNYPNPEYDMYGFEYVLAKDNAYPIRTYLQFEHSMSEEYFKDPLANLLEALSTAKPGEQLWLQILVTPNDGSWKKKAKDTVDEIMGKKAPVKKQTMVDGLFEWPKLFANQAFGVEFADVKSSDSKPDVPKMMSLTPAERGVLEAVQIKASKHGYDCSMRMIYVAKHDIFHRFRLTGAVGASLGVFTSLDSNGLKRYGKVAPKYQFPWQRAAAPRKQRLLMANYKNRSNAGGPPFILNSEELATLWHFPYKWSKAPSVQKTEAKRAEPPASLPTAESVAPSPFTPLGAAPAAAPPAGIPLVQDEDEEGEE
jgi:hypothetical protein